MTPAERAERAESGEAATGGAAAETPPSEATFVRLALALIAMCTTAAALYAVLRVAQALLFTEPDPALVIWSEHAGFFWRAWTVVYLGGMAAFLAWLASARHALRVGTFLATALPIAAALLIAQALLVP